MLNEVKLSDDQMIFSIEELWNAIKETFAHRGTSLDDIVAFEPEFTQDTVRQNRWNSFIKKKKAMVKVDFVEAIAQSKRLLMPIVKSINENKDFRLKWNQNKKDWI